MLSGFKDKVTSSLNAQPVQLKGCSELTQKTANVQLAVFFFLDLPGCFFSLYIALGLTATAGHHFRRE